MYTNPTLEAAILADPSDEAPYLVYGDWLQQQGDPTGELVTVQHALATDPEDPDLLKLEAELMERYAEHFFGPAHPFSEHDHPLRQEVDRWRRQPGWPAIGWCFGYALTNWRNGFLHSLFFDTGFYCGPDNSQGGEAAAEILSGLLGQPSARFVQEIVVGEIWGDDGEGPELGRALAAIAAAPCARVVHTIRLVGGDHDISGVSCDASALWGRCPALEELTLYGGQIQLGEPDTSTLRRLAIHSGSLDGEVVRRIGAARWPRLQRLELWLGCEEYGGSSSVADLMPILQGEGFPELRWLGLMNGEFGDEICRVLPSAAILPQLEALDLTMGILTDAGARVLIEHADQLSHLELSLDGYFSDEIADTLRGLGFRVSVRGDADEEYRYTEVGE